MSTSFYVDTSFTNLAQLKSPWFIERLLCIECTPSYHLFIYGLIFSAKSEFTNCIRLNCGYPDSARQQEAIATLGRLIAAQH